MEAFDAVIVEARGGGACVEVPAGVVEALRGGGRIKVQATFDGVPYRGSVVSMGGRKVLGMLKEIRTQLDKAPGDRVAVTLELDTSVRTVAVADDLAAALDGAGLRGTFDGLSYSHRREYVNWIDEARKPETRARRIAGTVERLS